MKKMFLVILVLFSAGFAQAGQLSESPEAYAPEHYLPGYPAYGSSYAFCRAETICPNGMPVGCYAYGNSYYGTACNWRVIPGRYVECTGYNDLGMWATSWFSCY